MQRTDADRDRNVPVRLNKYLSEAGVCSRREADRLIEAGKVYVDGRRAETGIRILPGQDVRVEGKQVGGKEQMALLAFYKPRGVVCTTDRRWGDRIIEDVLDYPQRVFYIGRLDKDSEGLLLMTNNGDIVNKIMREGNAHEKEYLVTVDKPVTEDFLKGMGAGGLVIQGRKTLPCRVWKTGGKSFGIVLTQGLNRQIRRMCAHFGREVVTLKRVRVMNIRLGDLRPGKWRRITGEEQERLFALLKDSANTPAYRKDKKKREEEKWTK